MIYSRMNRRLLALSTCAALATSGVMISPAVGAKPAPGKSCAKKQRGKTAKAASGATLKCVKAKGRYRWKVVKAAPAPTPAPAPSPAPAPTPTPPARAGSDRSSPIPLGQTATLYDGWTMSVVSFTPDATSAVLAENMFNDPPPAGQQFAIARVTATNATANIDRFDGSYRLRSVGASGVGFTTFGNSCGVIPDPISSASVFQGGTITGNVCWSIPSSDAGSLVLYDGKSSSAWTYFALR